jgi:hypothetical protein
MSFKPLPGLLEASRQRTQRRDAERGQMCVGETCRSSPCETICGELLSCCLLQLNRVTSDHKSLLSTLDNPKSESDAHLIECHTNRASHSKVAAMDSACIRMLRLTMCGRRHWRWRMPLRFCSCSKICNHSVKRFIASRPRRRAGQGTPALPLEALAAVDRAHVYTVRTASSSKWLADKVWAQKTAVAAARAVALRATSPRPGMEESMCGTPCVLFSAGCNTLECKRSRAFDL